MDTGVEFEMKKNGVLTYIFACIPGAGQMYMGYMKLGSSTMVLFAFLWFVTYTMRMDKLSFLLPVLWFFSFFDTLNKGNSSKTEDHYILSDHAKSMQSGVYKIVLVFILLLCGISTLMDVFVPILAPMFPWQISNFLWSIQKGTPKVIIAVFVIYVGITIFKSGKKA